MREVMVALGNADSRVTTVAPVVGKDERGDARGVALKREDEHVGHEPNMLLIVRGDTQRPRVSRPACDARGAGAQDALFDLPDPGEILIELASVGDPQRGVQPLGVVRHEIEEAPELALLAAAAIVLFIPGRSTKEALEHLPWTYLLGDRSCFAAPGEVRLVGAAIA